MTRQFKNIYSYPPVGTADGGAYTSAGVAAMAAYYPGIDTTSIILGNQTCNVWELHWKAEQIIMGNA